MAVQFHPSIFPFASSLPKPPRRLFVSATGKCGGGDTAVLWYKHDLRVQDHPGLLAAASSHGCIVPLYIFDRRILRRFSDEMVELLLFALEDLRKSLQQQGSNLMIRAGRAENAMLEVAKEVQASKVFIEEEVEHELRTMLEDVNQSLSSSSGSKPEIVIWSTPFYDNSKRLQDSPWSFDEFRKLKLEVLPPLVQLPELSGNAVNLPWGDLPSLAEVKDFVNDKDNVLKEWTYLGKFSAMDQLRKKRRSVQKPGGLDEGSKDEKRRKPLKSAFVTSQENLVGGGASLVLNALAAYLRYLEGTGQDEWQEVHEKIRLAETRQGASFDALFRSALSLGIISRRQVYFEAIKYEKDRNGGFLSPFGYSTTTVAAAIDSVSSMEWYWRLALKRQENQERNSEVRIWKWKNYLIEYTVAGNKDPNVLLVHGFGAFFEHYRDNILPIAEAGNIVWAITLIGFGNSEKPNMQYTELMWAELIRDFIIEVVQEPAHLVGNSIGGYIVAIVAGLWPNLTKSVVLINSAGNIVPGYSAFGDAEDRRISPQAWLGARLLLVYLRFNAWNILKSLYPTRIDRADEWLINKMLRASNDPGVIFILESIFSFDLSLPLNYLLEGFQKKVLVMQGLKDPLLDSKAKLAVIKEHFSDITIKEIDAGHCPHDELPDEVNIIIKEWVEMHERDVLQTIPQECYQEQRQE